MQIVEIGQPLLPLFTGELRDKCGSSGEACGFFGGFFPRIPGTPGFGEIIIAQK